MINLMSSESTIQSVNEILSPFFSKKLEIAAAFLFGSRATAKIHSLSDVDIAVLLYNYRLPEISFMYKPELLTDLMKILKRNDVDLVVLNQAVPFLKYRIFRDGVCIFDRDNVTRFHFHAHAYSEYFDIKPFLDRIYAI